MGKLIVVPGIITHASRTHIKTTRLAIRCKNCGHEKILETGQGFGSVNIPRTCDNA
jgi:DNA replication licensing factor MCM5